MEYRLNAGNRAVLTEDVAFGLRAFGTDVRFESFTPHDGGAYRIESAQRSLTHARRLDGESIAVRRRERRGERCDASKIVERRIVIHRRQRAVEKLQRRTAEPRGC